MTTTTILLGNLRLVGEPWGETVTARIEGCQSTIVLTPGEWQSLVHVAAVVEAAKEWRDRGPGQSHCEEEDCPCTSAECQLKKAIDTLTAGGEK